MGKSDGPKPPPKKFGKRKKKEGEASSGASSKSISPKSIINRLHITKKSGVSTKKKSEEEEGTQVVPSKDVEIQPVESTTKEGTDTITKGIDQETVEKIQESKEEAEVEETPEDSKPQEEDEHTDKTSEDTTTSNETQAAQNGIKRECLYKVLVIGELGTGKTSIIKRYVHQFFSQHYRATIGVDFALKVINWDQNTIIRLQLWDIAGQERFGNMTRVYYKEAVGAFIVFDVTRAATFDAVSKWKQDLDAKVQLADGSPIPCVLLANKCDQQKEGIVNNPNKMNDYCEEHKFTAWYETSAKENINIEEAAKTLVDQIVRNDSSAENGRTGSRDSSKFPLEGAEEYAEGKNCSC